MKLAERRITQRGITWKEALSGGLVRYPQLLVASVVVGLYLLAMAVAGGALSVIAYKLGLDAVATIPVIAMLIAMCYLVCVYSFFPYAVGLTSASGTKALRYSAKLVRGQFWRVVCYFIALYAVSGFLSVLMASVGWGISAFIGHFFGNIPLGLAVFVDGICDFTADFALPFQAALITLFFLNTAYLKDGVR